MYLHTQHLALRIRWYSIYFSFFFQIFFLFPFNFLQLFLIPHTLYIHVIYAYTCTGVYFMFMKASLHLQERARDVCLSGPDLLYLTWLSPFPHVFLQMTWFHVAEKKVHRVCMTHFIHSSDDGHLSQFHCLVIVGSSVRNVHV